MLKNFFLMFILLIQIVACQTEDIIKEEANIELSISVPESAGVKFKASFLGFSQDVISESGFLISSQPNVTFENSIVLIGVINNNKFENDINTDLVYNNQYYVKAYIKKNSSEIFYSEEKPFVSLGSKAPLVKSVTKAHILDTITIKGRYFTDKTNNIKVSFGTEASKVILSNDTIIKCIVPETIKKYNPILEIKVYEKKVINQGFSLFTPIIKTISSLQATFRDELVIYGDHFDLDVSRNKVYFGNIEAPIVSSNRNTLKVLVPDDLEKSKEIIKVVTQLQEVLSEDNFHLKAPTISFVKKDIYSREEIFIQGENFHPIKNKNIISFEGVEAAITNGDTKTLNTKVPYGPFPRRKAKVEIKLLDTIVAYEVELNILDKWVMVSDNLPFFYHGSMHSAVVANNTAYIITQKRGDFDEFRQNIYLWKFIPEDFSWEEKKIPFSIDIYEESGAVVESDGNNIYVYLPNSENDFWEFDTASSIWSKKAKFIGEKRSGATHFSINGEIYIGLGIDSKPYIPVIFNDFYKYSPSNNNWIKIADLPLGIKRRWTGSFVINGMGYFSGGAYNTGDYDCWSYNSYDDTWSRIADFESSKSGTSSFSLNGFGYVTGGSSTGGSNTNGCWQYNSLLDKWTKVENVGHIPRGRHFSFSVNNKAYVGGGGIYSGGSSGYDMYEYIP